MTDSPDEWTTAEVAAYLGVGRRAVHPTLTRWGIQPLDQPRRSGRGWTLVYRAADVIHAKTNAPGRGNRRTDLHKEDGRAAPAQQTSGTQTTPPPTIRQDPEEIR